jgi:hypothetical protein
MSADSLLRLFEGQTAMLTAAVFVAIASIVAAAWTVRFLRRSTWRNGEASWLLMEELDRSTHRMNEEYYGRKRAETKVS